MKKKWVKKGFELAQKELKEEKIKKVKEIVKKILEEIAELDKKIKELQEKKRYLKMDIEDLKEGRLDRIEERLKKDKKAREHSLIKVEKLKEGEIEEKKESKGSSDYSATWSYSGGRLDTGSIWYSPYTISVVSSSGNSAPVEVSGSLVKFATPGAYEVGDKVVNLR